MWLLSNRGRDRISLVRLDLKTGQESLVYEDPRTDVEGVLISYHTKNPLIAFSNPDYQKLFFFDSRSKHDFFYRRVEEFLAEHLGGRSAEFDVFQLGI